MEGMPSSMVSNQKTGISSPDDRRRSRNESGNGKYQTLDHLQLHHHNYLNHHLNQQPPPQPPHIGGGVQNPDPNPDPAPVAASTVSKPLSPLPQQSQPPILYRECQRNHAASTGGYVVDGCGEFMPAEGEGNPKALKCAACDCHRNFHRREVNGGLKVFPSSHHHAYNPTRPSTARPAQHHQRNRPAEGPVMVAFGRTPADSSSEDLNVFQVSAGAQQGREQPPFSGSKKRFRTKFNQEQKIRMRDFAEKLGWKMQKQNEEEVRHFLDEVGVKREVFKVWMHNDKQAMKKKQLM